MGFHPVFVDGEPVGWAAAAWLPALLSSPNSPWLSSEAGVVLDPTLADPVRRTDALATWAQALHARRPVQGWRNERVRVLDPGGAPLFSIERALLRPLGLPLRSVQVNVYGDGPQGPVVWVARRAMHKPVAPGLMDSLVAGGIAGDDPPFETMLRECAEEAGIPAAVAQGARTAGTLATHYLEADPGSTHPGASVLHRELLQVYDLRLPPGFVPRPVDGEHEAVFAMSPAALAQSLGTNGWSGWTREGAAATLAFLRRIRIEG
jgi:8-oxo-dGTP pyrophosphatase MutT (NUDIX family)